MKKLLPLILLLVFSAALHAQRHPQCDTVVHAVDTAKFKSLLEKHDGVLIDVRTPDEYKTGYIKGAINIDFRAADFKEQIAKLDKSKTYYVYCELGKRSDQAAAYMKSQGFCKVIVLDKGLKQWKAAGYPLEVPH